MQQDSFNSRFESLRDWFDLKKYSGLDQADEIIWAKLICYRLAILFYLDNPLLQSHLTPNVDESDSLLEALFLRIIEAPIDFPNNLNNASKAALLSGCPSIYSFWNFDPNSVDSVWEVAVGDMARKLSYINRLNSENSVLTMIENGRLIPDDTPDWFYSSFHEMEAKVMKDIFKEEQEYPNELIIGIDLNASSKHIIEDFKRLLHEIKTETNTSKNTSRHRLPDLKTWEKCRLLPYVDIYIWEKLVKKKLNRLEILDELFNCFEVKDEDSTFRKTTLPNFNKVFPKQEGLRHAVTRTLDNLLYSAKHCKN